MREGLAVDVVIKALDEDTAIVTVAGEAPAATCLQLHEALHEAERLGKPGLVIDLSDLHGANHHVLTVIAACQHRAIGAGRWLLVVPPRSELAAESAAGL